MVTPEVTKFKITPFWDHEYKELNYIHEPFNDPISARIWSEQGYRGPVTGVMCDMKQRHPVWTDKIIKLFTAKGWNDIGVCFYRMDTGVILPVHKDLYLKYIQLFDLQGKEQTIFRAIIFLEDWQSGHYAEYCNEPFVNWKAGDGVYWQYDALHMAANIGLTPRYTLQITGHL